ncbi:Cupin superfamily protein [Mariniflexile rhizosphaerae]|uniref:cupin-like domain-containing protein n=1 Tax=unclassified Mariniflexile TaxID=2643887 RepID=UPI000CAA49C7|nr:cupin-like domain-containing protein [Mariniflexile sp. TRM1-10]AXP82436.1 Cupin superfamily protein [Mariniflexile sp. TRM1-10]PLB18376.1 MAG: JmjC domain protein [Flavobacteriaceae bacterium FS1-H7996/R]
MNILNEIIALSSPVEEVPTLDSSTFKKRYFNKKPIVIRGLAKEWNATKNWDLDFFLNLKEDKDVDLLEGNFIQDDNRYKKSSFKSFIKKLIDAETNKEEIKDYLTTLDIFNYFPSLKNDVDFSIFEDHTQINDITAWIGPSGTISGFHNDTGKNMYSQIKGRKMFIIAAPKYNKKMYPSPKYINGGRASKVDINNFTPEKFPKFKEVKFLHVILEPGDVLHVPAKWWHYVQSLDTSISVSNFGFSKLEMFGIKALDYIHRRGYYKPKNCFCCN